LRAPERAAIPLVRRFPALASVPRVSLGRFPTPVQRASGLAPGLWIKRDDLSGDALGGNKVRALEFLLGDIEPEDHVVTVGALGSTHALTTAIYARRLGARVTLLRWPQEMNEAAEAVQRRTLRTLPKSGASRNVAIAYLRAALLRLRGARWIPAGGSTPLGILGHVNGALELAEQIARGEMPVPERIVVPLGSGGTAAGLALGMCIAGLPTEIVGARVVPRVIANRAHVMRLARATARFIERAGGTKLPRLARTRVRVIHDAYGGAYGRELALGREAATRCRNEIGMSLDATYSAKAMATALAIAGEKKSGATLFWLTFDGRVLQGARS
jgi:1-aminocyclopropane-1-carboxylate deaminase/D-cysteine desulfhydrase-like pyridoxal-dependent ACC family enzyme